MVALILPRNSRNSQKFGGAVGCVGMAGCHTLLICAHLWKPLLCQKIPCVLCVLWEYSLPRISQINTDGWLRYSPTDFTEFTEVWGCCWLRGYGRMPYPPNLCASVPICGRCFSARRFCAFRGFCGNIVSHGFHRSTQMVGCVNSPTEFTEFTEVWLR